MEVTVSGLTHVIRAGQMSAALGVADLAARDFDPADHLTGRPRLGRSGLSERDRGACEGRGDRASRIGGDDDDRDRATRPRDIGDPSDRWHSVGVGERGIRAGGEDDRGDGHSSS